MPRMRDEYYNFFFIEWELNPVNMITTLAEIEKLQHEITNYPIKYYISKENNAITRVEIYANNRKFEESTYKNGLLDGKKIIYHTSGMPFQEIEYKKGKVDGVCKVYNSDDKLVLETNYKNNLKHGLRKYYGDKRRTETLEGNYENGNLISDLKYYDQYNNLTIFPNDLKTGKVQTFFNNNLVLDYTIVNQKIHGIVTKYNYQTKTVVSKTPYYLNQRNGFAEYYNNKGELLNKLEFKNDKKIGEHKKYSNDKTLLKEEYFDENGLKTGAWKEYNEQGKIVSEQNYKNDSLNGKSLRYNNEFLIEIAEYKNGKREGLQKNYNSKTSNLESEVYYANDRFYKEIVYYPNGKAFSIRDINPKNQETSIKYYNPDGSFFYENKSFPDYKIVGLHKIIEKIDNDLFVRTETIYDDKHNRTWQKSYGYKKDGSYTEYNFRNNVWHGQCKSFDATTGETKIFFYYEKDKKWTKVTKEEFDKLTVAEKK